MRSISPTANRLLTALMALALAWSTSLPWYAPAGTDPNPSDGPVEQAAWRLGRVFQAVGGTAAGTDGLLVAVALAVGVLALVLLAAPDRALGDVLRLAGLAPAVLVLASALSRPRGMSIHWGLLVGAAAALVLANAAWHGGRVRARRASAVSYR